MKQLFLLPIAFLIIIAFIQCSEEDGSIGEQGPAGPQGEAGLVGPAGDDGSMMYANDGEPLAEQGVAGDFYLDSSTGELYGPKSNDGWGEATIVLMGQNGKNGEDGTDGANGVDGANGIDGEDGKDGDNGIDGEDGNDGVSGSNGTDGSKIYAAELEISTMPTRIPLPNPKIGKNGDYFLDQTNHNLFGPKTNGSWGINPINLKGPKGNDGADGSDGADGNANVIQYVFGEFTVDNISSVFTIPATRNTIENSLVQVYVKVSSTWYPIPGKEFGAVIINGYVDRTNVFIAEATRAEGEKYDALRIVIVEVGNTVNMNARTMPDFNDYEAVSDHFGMLR